MIEFEHLNNIIQSLFALDIRAMLRTNDFIDFKVIRWYSVSMRKNTTIYHRVRIVRQALKLTQREFARQVGLAQTALSMIEVGKNTLTDKVLKLICAEFGVNETWMRTGKGEMLKQSPHLKELGDILVDLTPETQQYLLQIARGLLDVQKTLLEKSDNTTE